MTPSLFRAVLPVADLTRADSFWSRLLDLEPDRGVAGRHYLHTAGAILVLVDPVEHDRAHGRPPRPFRPQAEWLYFRVPDLEATWRRARELGCPVGAAEADIRVRAWGERSFYTRDPFGNPVCFVDDAQPAGAGPAAAYRGKPIANLFRLVLPSRSLGRSDAFFEELLGLPVDAGVWNRHVFHTGACMLALVDTAGHDRAHGGAPREFRPNPDLVYFAVPDLEACYDRARSLAMHALPGEGDGIRAWPWGERSFYGLDPSGNPIGLVDERTLYTGSPP
jgi:catechol 2,3-dioxygenase-like lactoylglutathione lyase family enzyme